MIASISTCSLIQQPAGPFFGSLTLISAGISLSLSFGSLLCFLACFFSLKSFFKVLSDARNHPGGMPPHYFYEHGQKKCILAFIELL